MEKLKLKQSRHWWVEKDLKWLIEHASYVYCISNDFNRPIIVTVDNMMRSYCYKIDTDGCGITLSSHWEYFNQPDVIRRSNDVKSFIIDFLNNYGASEYVNPSFDVLNIFRKRKDKIIII